MNCANHPDVEKVAFCRTCGKPLCANCTRSVQGVIYCESCLAARLEGVQPNVAAPVAGFVAAAPAAVAVGGSWSESGAGRRSGRLLSLRRGRGLLRTIRQGPGPPGDLHFLLILGVSSGSGTAGLVFGLAIGRVLLLSDYRFHPLRPGHTAGTGAARSVRAGDDL